jgi:hypothetical protein
VGKVGYGMPHIGHNMGDERIPRIILSPMTMKLLID